VYTSHNAHPEDGTIRIRYIPFDFDAEDKRENAQHDALKLADWANDRGLVTRFAFSGNKGFHGYLAFDPVRAKNNQALKRAYLSIQQTARRDAGLRTADEGIEGDTRRLMRVVNTQHQDSDYYCVELTTDQLERWDIAEVLDYAKQPRSPPEYEDEPSEGFHEAVQRLDVDIQKRDVWDQRADAQTVPYESEGGEGGTLTEQFVRDLLPRPCIHNDLLSQNPEHMTRVEACSWLVTLGYGIQWLIPLFDDIAEDAAWVDRFRKDLRDYHVLHIWRKGGYHPHSCQKLRANGLCVGEDCPLFRHVWPDEVDEEVNDDDAPYEEEEATAPSHPVQDH
jgi:hypothetical protein